MAQSVPRTSHHDITFDDTVFPRPEGFKKRIDECLQDLVLYENNYTNYIRALIGLEKYLIDYQKYIFARIRKYRKQFMSRKHESYIRKSVLCITMRMVKSIQEEYNNTRKISDIDIKFLYNMIKDGQRRLYNIGLETFRMRCEAFNPPL